MSAQQLARLIVMTYVLQTGAVLVAATALWLSTVPQGRDFIAVARTVIDFVVAWYCFRMFMSQAALRDRLRAEYDRIRGPWRK